MRAHLVQFDIAWEDKTANFERVRALIGEAGVAPGDLVVLPEMFDTGFSMNVERTADTDASTARFLEELADRTGAVVHGAQTVMGPDGRARNRALILGAGGAPVVYDKIHPFSFGRESERFVGGDRVVTYDWAGPEGALRVCPAVCYDLRFPELFRAGLDRGAEAFALGANWPAERAAHWRALAIARAIENQAFVFAVNRAGSDPKLRYAGGSIGVDPRGVVLGELGPVEGVLSIRVEASSVREWRETFPAWRDRRIGRTPVEGISLF